MDMLKKMLMWMLLSLDPRNFVKFYKLAIRRESRRYMSFIDRFLLFWIPSITILFIFTAVVSIVTGQSMLYILPWMPFHYIFACFNVSLFFIKLEGEKNIESMKGLNVRLEGLNRELDRLAKNQLNLTPEEVLREVRKLDSEIDKAFAKRNKYREKHNEQV